MAKTRAYLHETRRWHPLVAGVLLTAAVAAMVPVRGWLEPRFQDELLAKKRPPQTASEEITVVQIDDAALSRIQKWPWSWDKMAGVINTLTTLGARVIVLDIIYSEVPEPEVRRGTLTEYPTGEPLLPAEAVTGDQAGPLDAPYVRLEPLPILVQAIADSRRTVVPFFISTEPRIDHPLFVPLRDLLRHEPGLEAAEAARRLDADEDAVRRMMLTTRLRALELRLADGPPLDPDDGEAMAARFAELFPGHAYDAHEGFGAVFGEAARHADASRAVAEAAAVDCQCQADQLTGDPAVALRITPPVHELVPAAAGLGFANVFPDPDGIIRRVPLIVQRGRRVLPQLGLRAAMLAHGAAEFTLCRREGSMLEVGLPDGRAIGVPIGARGEMIINWARGPEGRSDPFRHLPISPLYEYALLKRSWHMYREALSRAASRLGGDDLVAELRAEFDAAAAAGKLELTELQGGLAFELYKAARSKRPEGTSPRQWRLLRDDESVLLGDRQGLMMPDDAPRIEADFARMIELADELRPAIEDRVCLVGMTATSAALDLKPTPLDKDSPGVLAHAAVIDNLLQQKFIRHAGPVAGLGAIFAVGLAVSLVAARLPAVRATLASVALLGGGYYALCWVLFTYRGTMMPLAGPWMAGLVSLLGVMTYRELTEGRDRRWITSVFKQYTSDTMVNELVANPDFLVLGGQRRDMTVYFSDIAGFTSLSERLDPARLVEFLQAYLGEMTDRLLEQGATLDKYEGDAVLAFFNAPIDQADHAERCLRAALAHLRALPQLDRALHEQGFLPEDYRLRVRIGISTGQIVVGNFGSARRFDYTVIGDSVNVGARLEGANRFFGTTVLLSGATRQQVSDGAFLMRRIGPVRFVGKGDAVDVYELLDPDAAGAAAGLQEYHAALEHFEAGRLREARDLMEHVLELRGDDGPTRACIERIDDLLQRGAEGPPGPWDMTAK